MTSFDLPAAQTALVLIDLQHGIVGLPLQPISATVLLEAARVRSSVAIVNAVR